MTLKSRMFFPPGGRWFYTVPATGWYAESSESLETLLGVLGRHYAVNNLAVPEDLQALVEDFICLNTPAGACDGPDPRSPAQMPLTYFEITDVMRTLWAGGPKDLVEPREAEARALICVRCKAHSMGMCTRCNELQAQASRYVGRRTLMMDPKLGICEVIRVPTNGLVHVRRPPAPTDLPENCWILPNEEKPK